MVELKEKEEFVTNALLTDEETKVQRVKEYLRVAKPCSSAFKFS